MHEGMENICHQKENTDFWQKINAYNNERIPDDVKDV
jgi:hypothetical protein